MYQKECKYFYEKEVRTREIGMVRGFALELVPVCEKVDAFEKQLLECEDCELYEE